MCVCDCEQEQFSTLWLDHACRWFQKKPDWALEKEAAAGGNKAKVGPASGDDEAKTDDANDADADNTATAATADDNQHVNSDHVNASEEAAAPAADTAVETAANEKVPEQASCSRKKWVFDTW